MITVKMECFLNFGRYELCDAIYTCVFRQFRFQSKTQQNCLGKTVLKMWSQKSTSRTSLVPRIRPRFWTLLCFFCLFFLHFFLKVVLWTHRLFFTNLRPHFENSFPSTFYFLLLNLKCLETCVNCVTKCTTAKFAPWKSKFQAFPI